MDKKQAEAFSEAINKKLLSLEKVMKADCIMAFYSYKNEPYMIGFMHECMGMGKQIALPRIIGEGKMAAAVYSRDSELKNNAYGIPEPYPGNIICKPDVVIVPGLAFDLNRNRIGFGKGYYDRFLKGSEAYKIGVCFDYQIVEKIDAGSHDVPVDIVVTEERIIGEL